MFENVKEFQGENPNVWKFVFEKEDACVESVLYKYESFENRTVLCVSVQSGCPVGCVFCGTGKQFVRNLTEDEIIEQVITVLKKVIDSGTRVSSIARLQIMFMSMGEPMLNWTNVRKAIQELKLMYPNAELLLSTIGVDDDQVFGEIIRESIATPKLGLQFSVHSAFDSRRDSIIPFKKKMDLRKLRDAGINWHNGTNRPVYLNLCVDKYNMGAEEIRRLKDLFSPLVFNLTFSVICEYENGKIKDECEKKTVEWRTSYLMQEFLKDGYNVRKFDPAGQDDIGAGCGQLWYVQEWMKGRKESPCPCKNLSIIDHHNGTAECDGKCEEK